LPIRRALALADQLCQALEHVHRHGIVHGNLRPDRIWLTPEGDAKVGGFGRALSFTGAERTAGAVVGGEPYLAPEQVSGGALGPRSDLFALGAILHEMLMGWLPGARDTRGMLLGSRPATPEALSELRPDLPPAVASLLLRLLQPDPLLRPASAEEVRQELAAASAAGAPDTKSGVRPLYRRHFVGREPELAALQAAFDDAALGNGSLRMVVGELGIGKTALLEQLVAYATRRGGCALVGHCYQEALFSLPYVPFAEVLRAYLTRRTPTALLDELGAGAADIARIVPALRDHLPQEGRPTGDPEEDRWRLMQSVTGLLRRAAAAQPLLLVIEDLHWADRATLDLLAHLSRDLHDTRLLLVGADRDVEVDRTHPLSAVLAELRRTAGFERVLLRGLTPAEVRRAASRITGEEVGEELAEAVHRHTEGNPLFVQQLTQYLVEEGALRPAGGRTGAVAAAPLAFSIPEGLREVIGRQLSRLSPECNQLLRVAAVIGREFELAILQEVAGTPEDALLTALEEALRVAVLQEEAHVGGVRYHFAHSFFRQTLYEELIAPRR
ncbi:MAG: DUF2791 family P-loop domain-containing protein, partial [Chloroflexi bacterium]|nr:DUF2791 family P-loop domain-containing protein [Chloroflexota bacterium]